MRDPYKPDPLDNGWRLRIRPGLAGQYFVCACQPDLEKARSLIQHEYLSDRMEPMTPALSSDKRLHMQPAFVLTYAACVNCKRMVARLDKWEMQ